MKVLFIADIVGQPGRRIVNSNLARLKEEFNIDFIIANAENSAGGFGITPLLADELFTYGIDVLTLGNHLWDKKEIIDYLPTQPRVLKALNLPSETPGHAFYLANAGGIKVAVFYLLGRVFMGDCIAASCPFKSAIAKIEELKQKAKIIIVEIHCEATSEKKTMGYFLNGKVSAVIGSHTHVATADYKVLSKGTAYITDIGMTGPVNSVIGINKDIILNKFLTGMPARFEVAKGIAQLEAVVIDIDNETGRAADIQRIYLEEGVR